VVEDFDGDCLSDIIISDPAAAEIIFYKQAEGSGLAEPLRFPALADVTELSAADIDNDGKSELSMLTVKEKIIGLCKYNDGRFSFPQPIEINGEPLTAQLADIDSDSSIDCVYISKDANDCRSLRVIYDLAAATKSLPNQQTCSELKLEKLTCNPAGLKIHDVDQDGLEDVLIFVKYELPILVRQTKKRNFKVVDAPGIQASLIKDASVQSTAVANVFGDDKAELLLAQNNFARSLVFAKAKKWTVKDQYNARGRNSRIVSVAAFDLDDRDDDTSPAILLLDGQKGQLQILKAGSDKTYRFDRELDVGRWNTAADHLKMLFAPLAGSSINNILLFDSEKFALITAPTAMKTAMHLEKILSYETKITDGAYGNLALGDINDNGRADIIMVEHNRNHIEILALDSQTKPHPAMRFKVFEEKSYRQQKHGPAAVEPRELKIADVTGDGKNDLVTIIHDRIIIYPQD
jgi:hypothetical protein